MRNNNAGNDAEALRDTIPDLIHDITDIQTRELALIELSKKREQYEELAPLLWHSFGKNIKLLNDIRCHVSFTSGDRDGVSVVISSGLDRARLQPRMQRPSTLAMCSQPQ